jgi:hypothetical protein
MKTWNFCPRKREICSKKSGLKWCSWNLKGPYTKGKSAPHWSFHHRPNCENGVPAHVTGVHKMCLQITMFGRSQRQASQPHVQRMYTGNFKKGWCGVYKYTVHPAALGNMMPSGWSATGLHANFTWSGQQCLIPEEVFFYRLLHFAV